MEKRIISLAILFATFFISMLIFASRVTFSQDLTGPEKEVLKLVEGNWECLAKKDLKEFLNNFHQDYIGYVNWRESPIDKEELAKAIINRMQTMMVTSYKIEPFSVKLYDNVAVVLYRCNLNEADDKGQTFSADFRYTDVLLKTGEKWLIVAAHKEKIK